MMVVFVVLHESELSHLFGFPDEKASTQWKFWRKRAKHRDHRGENIVRKTAYVWCTIFGVVHMVLNSSTVL